MSGTKDAKFGLDVLIGSPRYVKGRVPMEQPRVLDITSIFKADT